MAGEEGGERANWSPIRSVEGGMTKEGSGGALTKVDGVVAVGVAAVECGVEGRKRGVGLSASVVWC